MRSRNILENENYVVNIYGTYIDDSLVAIYRKERLSFTGRFETACIRHGIVKDDDIEALAAKLLTSKSVEIPSLPHHENTKWWADRPSTYIAKLTMTAEYLDALFEKL